MWDNETKVELFTYIMGLGKETALYYSNKDLPGLIELCITANNARKELIKQANNVKRGEGSVNGKWYEGTITPFQDKIKRVRANIIKRAKAHNPLIKMAFDSNGDAFIVFPTFEIDLSKF